MKNIKIILISALALVSAVVLPSCTNYDWTNTHDTIMTGFDIITGNLDYDVTSEDAEELLIEWTPATTNDHTLVFYKVLFSTTADMANLFYEVEALNFGTETSINLPASQVNIIAELGGIPQNSKGSVYWTVMANTGVTKEVSKKVQTLTVTRPDGFAYNPEHLFIETPEGEYLSMKKQADGKFEYFGTLGSGEYKIAERMAGGKTRYFSAASGKLISDGSFNNTKPGEVSHIYVDFNTSEASVAIVNSVSLLYLGTPESPVKLSRMDGKGAMWQGVYHFERVDNTYTYKFIVDETTTDGKESQSYFGYQRANATSQTANSPADYFYLFRCADAGTSYCFRFGNANNFQMGKDLMITVDLNSEGEEDPYTHSVEVL